MGTTIYGQGEKKFTLHIGVSMRFYNHLEALAKHGKQRMPVSTYARMILEKGTCYEEPEFILPLEAQRK